MGATATKPVEERVFRRESLTPFFLDDAVRKIKESGALNTAGHFIHHEGTGIEFHSRTWFKADVLFRDPTTMFTLIPAMVHQLPEDIISATDLVIGVVTGGAVMAPMVANYMQSDGPLAGKGAKSIACMFMRKGDDGYVLNNLDCEWLAGWRIQHGRYPNCLLLDDVYYSGDTTINCFESLRRINLPVTSILHVAAATTAKPKIIGDVPMKHLFEFAAGETYKPRKCPMCAAGQEKTIL